MAMQLAIVPQKSSVTLFTFDTHQSQLHPQMRIGDAVARWAEPVKSWVSRRTPTLTSAIMPVIVPNGLQGLLTSWKP